ncbi:carbon-nitrogen hydrolase family protein [Alkaliphilus hydrothermalis]|uniref:hypothetical protein n=1 Tax=Alkaliphilus hydrothermalis TaxID=1482730 RepID=UPI001959ECD8|nr:hypothetical protein [Alkaliphilus hydrothermalis]
MIRQVANEGAKPVALPELSSCGYIPNQTIWEDGELKNGDTATRAGLLAKELGIFVGVGQAGPVQESCKAILERIRMKFN